LKVDLNKWHSLIIWIYNWTFRNSALGLVVTTYCLLLDMMFTKIVYLCTFEMRNKKKRKKFVLKMSSASNKAN